VPIDATASGDVEHAPLLLRRRERGGGWERETGARAREGRRPRRGRHERVWKRVPYWNQPSTALPTIGTLGELL
jgi:hypothetical protein